MTRTKIEWATHTWNPVTGCTKVSEGCRHCYAERMVKRFGGRVHAGDGTGPESVEFGRVILHPEKLEQPLHWRKPRRVFVCSMSDLFHPDVPFEFIDSVFAAMLLSTSTFMVLTKRPGRMCEYVTAAHAGKRTIASAAAHGLERGFIGGAACADRISQGLPNIWLGVSVENQATADERIPLLLQTPAAVRFVSCEPMLGPVALWHRLSGGSLLNMGPVVNGPGIQWVICGGESGPGARPMHPDWARSLRDQCAAAQVPFFFKQWGEWQVASRANGHVGSVMPNEGSRYTWLGIDGRAQNPSSHGLGDDAYAMARVGKKSAGRELDGLTHEEFPEVRT